MKDLGIWEPLSVKMQTYKTAVEVYLILSSNYFRVIYVDYETYTRIYAGTNLGHVDSRSCFFLPIFRKLAADYSE
jgi:hypothetical protein